MRGAGGEAGARGNDGVGGQEFEDRGRVQLCGAGAGAGAREGDAEGTGRCDDPTTEEVVGATLEGAGGIEGRASAGGGSGINLKFKIWLHLQRPSG